MIHVDRSGVPIPDILTGVNAGPQERDRAIEYYRDLETSKKKQKPGSKIKVVSKAKTKPKPKAFLFRVYKDPTVKEALERLFHNKCAYCEFPYPAAHPVDVEHWRPKGSVATNDGKALDRGYYWLAATWENLLPSCIHCNRESKHYQHGKMDRKTLSGKTILFPLADESKRLRKPMGKNQEQPLLLNPCEDFPEDHLEFPADPECAGIVRARKTAGVESARGRASIDVYGLIRSELVQVRIAHYKVIAAKMTDVERWSYALAKAATDEDREKFAQWRDECVTALKNLRDSEVQFAQMARQIIDPFLSKWNL